MYKITKYKLNNSQKEDLENIGNKIIRNNQYAVVSIDGGQGTGIGHVGPKRTFLLNINPKLQYLFEIFIINEILEERLCKNIK